VEVAVYGAAVLSGHIRVSGDGNISIPLVGYVHVGELTSAKRKERLRINYVRTTFLTIRRFRYS
jgi:protein involved in polysaccharide export with SLBB domain